MKPITIKDRIVLILAKSAARIFVFSTRFGKQTYAKRAIRNLYKTASK